MHYQDLLYDERDGVATITINRPQVHNAFRAATCEELIHAFTRAGDQRSIGVIVLTGAGDKAFCSGGDQSGTDTSYGGRGAVGLPIEPVHSLIRDVPQPVIARVQGYCIGGGNVLATLCDLTIASDRAVFGQAGPKMGSVDPGFGTAYLARVIGEKKARDVVPMPEILSGRGAVDGPGERGRTACPARCRSRPLVRRNPRSQPDRFDDRQAIVQRRQRSDPRRGALGFQALALYYQSDERREGAAAFSEKRKPDFRKFRK